MLCLGLLVTSGCGRPAPEGLGTVRQARGPTAGVPTAGFDAMRLQGRAEPVPEVAARVESVRAESMVREGAGPDVQWSSDGTHAVMYRRQLHPGEDVASLIIVSVRAERDYAVRVRPDAFVEVRWSPDSRYVVVCGLAPDDGGAGHVSGASGKAVAPQDRLIIYLLDAARRGRSVRSRRFPSGSAVWLWRLGPVNTDGSCLFLSGPTPDLGPGEIWSVSIPELEPSKLWTHPPPARWAPWIAKKVRRHMAPTPGEGNPPFEPMSYGKGVPPRGLLPSPSGRLLLFNSYSENYYPHRSLWLLKISTGEARQVTWQEGGPFDHWPVRWLDDESGFVFDTLAGRYELTLDPDLWRAQPGPTQ